jgi:hypothetical protein
MTSRRQRTALAVAGLLLLTNPPATLAAGANTITVRERKVDVNPDQTNPCTGVIGTIIDTEKDVFHITTLANGTLHLTGHSTATVTFTPDDPAQVAYTGHETFALSESSSRRSFVTTTTQNLRLKGSDSTFITLRQRTHLTVNPAGVIISFDESAFSCS